MPTPDPNNVLSTLIRHKREKLNLSNNHAARLAGISHATLLRIENGEVTQPTPGVLARLAQQLDLPLSDLYAAAGYIVPEQLPSIRPYLHARYGQLTEKTIRHLERQVEHIA